MQVLSPYFSLLSPSLRFKAHAQEPPRPDPIASDLLERAKNPFSLYTSLERVVMLMLAAASEAELLPYLNKVQAQIFRPDRLPPFQRGASQEPFTRAQSQSVTLHRQWSQLSRRAFSLEGLNGYGRLEKTGRELDELGSYKALRDFSSRMQAVIVAAAAD